MSYKNFLKYIIATLFSSLFLFWYIFSDYIIYVNNDDWWKLYKKNANDTDDWTPITSVDSFAPVSSPDGEYIVYKNRDSFNMRLYKKNANDTDNWTPITSVDSGWPTYSPDGEYIVYQNNSEWRSLYKTSPNDTDDWTAIRSWSSAHPVYSPDGEYIVYRRIFGSYELHKKNANDTDDWTAITSVSSSTPAYLPNINDIDDSDDDPIILDYYTEYNNEYYRPWDSFWTWYKDIAWITPTIENHLWLEVEEKQDWLPDDAVQYNKDIYTIEYISDTWYWENYVDDTWNCFTSDSRYNITECTNYSEAKTIIEDHCDWKTFDWSVAAYKNLWWERAYDGDVIVPYSYTNSCPTVWDTLQPPHFVTYLKVPWDEDGLFTDPPWDWSDWEDWEDWEDWQSCELYSDYIDDDWRQCFEYTCDDWETTQTVCDWLDWEDWKDWEDWEDWQSCEFLWTRTNEDWKSCYDYSCDWGDNIQSVCSWSDWEDWEDWEDWQDWADWQSCELYNSYTDNEWRQCFDYTCDWWETTQTICDWAWWELYLPQEFLDYLTWQAEQDIDDWIDIWTWWLEIDFWTWFIWDDEFFDLFEDFNLDNIWWLDMWWIWTWIQENIRQPDLHFFQDDPNSKYCRMFDWSHFRYYSDDLVLPVISFDIYTLFWEELENDDESWFIDQWLSYLDTIVDFVITPYNNSLSILNSLWLIDDNQKICFLWTVQKIEYQQYIWSSTNMFFQWSENYFSKWEMNVYDYIFLFLYWIIFIYIIVLILKI